MKTDEYTKYLVARLVRYWERPSEERKVIRRKKEAWQYRWFGMLPVAWSVWKNRWFRRKM